MSNNQDKSIRVLIVDDNPDDIVFYKHLLTSKKLVEGKYNVLTAESGEEAINICNGNEIDIYLIDQNMPGEDGVSLLNDLQMTFPERVFSAILLTGEANQNVQAEAARRGAMDYVVKDTATTPEKLDQIIEKVLNWSQKKLINEAP